MHKSISKKTIAVVMLAAVVLAACTTGAAEEPTPDLNAIRTEAVKTAMVEMTVQAALSPTETKVPPTLTPLPTATLSTDAAQPAAGSSSGSSSSGGSGGSSGTAIPTWTPDPYACEIVTEDPLDAPQMTGWIYDKTWTLRNVGTATWTKKDYYVKWAGGDDISPYHTYKIPHDVSPFQTVVVTIDVNVPTQPITEGIAYTANWQLISDNGDVVCRFTNVITRTYPPPTPTPD